jgi:DHA1 family multidrug resistance protein-like MFS transporter
LSSCTLSDKQALRNVNYLAALDMIVSLGFGLIMPLFPTYVKLLGGGALEVGILFSSFMLTRALLATTFGNLSDRIGRKKLILIGGFLYAFLAVLFVVPSSWIGLIFVRGLQGVASAMVWPVSEALVIDSCPPTRRGASLGKLVMASNLGMVIGPFIGGALYFLANEYLGFSETNSIRFPFYFTAIIALAGAILVWMKVVDAKAPQKTSERVTLAKLLKPDGMDRQGLTNLKVLYSNAFMEGFAFSSIGPLMAYYLPQRFGIEADVTAIMVGIAMGVGALIAYPAGRLSDRMGRKKLYIAGSFMAYLGVMLIPFGYALWIVIIFMSMRSMAFQVASPSLRALQADTVPEEVRGRLIGMLESMSNFGSILGAPIGGLLLDAYYGVDLGLPVIDGTMIPFFVSGALGLVTLSLVTLFVKEKRRTATVGAAQAPLG